MCKTRGSTEQCRRENKRKLERAEEYWNQARRKAYDALKEVNWENMTVLSNGMAYYGEELTSVATESIIPLGHGWRDYLRGVQDLLMQDTTIIDRNDPYATRIVEHYDWWATSEESWRRAAQLRREEEEE